MIATATPHDHRAPETATSQSTEDRGKTGSFDPLQVVWAALVKVGDGERSHHQLQEGRQHELDLQLSGHVDGQPLNQRVFATVAIGHDQSRSTSSTPQLPHVVAYILGKLNRQTQEKLLRELPSEFENNGGALPDADESAVDQAARLLKKLRASKPVLVRRAVRCQYHTDQCAPPLKA